MVVSFGVEKSKKLKKVRLWRREKQRACTCPPVRINLQKRAASLCCLLFLSSNSFVVYPHSLLDRRNLQKKNIDVTYALFRTSSIFSFQIDTPRRHNLTHVLHNSMSAFTVTSALAARVAAPKAARSARRSTVVRAAEEPVVVDATTEIPAKPVYVKPTSFTLQQAFAFSAPEGSNFIASGPELMNGRLAMLAFVAAAGAEISTGETVMQQFSEAPTAVLLTTALFVAATLKTFTTNTISDTIGPFTKEKELLNGRAAMIGMACLLGFEAIKHVPLL